MPTVSLHSWRLAPKRAVELQRRLASRISLAPLREPVRRIAGADVSYDPMADRFFAAIVVLAWPGLEVCESGRASGRTAFPYVPGLLSFREIPALLRAYRRLRLKPDLILCDGQGLAHPRFFGLACHLGLLLGVPALGCAKSLLVGTHGPVPSRRGGRVPLRYGRRRVGTVLRTREGVKPVFVSPGHRLSVRQAGDWALRCSRGHRLPEPTRLADREVDRMRRLRSRP